MKISVIMQSYLGEYSGSRLNPEQKFIRAVNSFLAQTYTDSELIIVSDNCDKTHRLYYDHFKTNNRIKYVYLDKDAPNMYDNGRAYYRGFPRQVGRCLATGEVTCYLDSDDYLLPHAIETLAGYWITDYDKYAWILNLSWYDNIKGKETYIDVSSDYCDPLNAKEIEIDGLSSKWYAAELKPGILSYKTSTLSHRSNIDTAWEDSTIEWEDVVFCKKMTKSYSGGTFVNPVYVQCHYSGKGKAHWDY